jgi:hypothetical protein
LTIHLKQVKGEKDKITIFLEKIRIDIEYLIVGKKIVGKNKNSFVFTSKRGKIKCNLSFPAS